MKKRNATETKELILNIARKEFAIHGYDGLRVDDLAKSIGINKATIYYHFKDKSFLYETILFEMTQNIQAHIKEKLSLADTPIKKLEAFLDGIIHMVSTNREVARILMQEISFNGKNVNDSVKAEFLKVIQVLISIINEGVEQNVFKNIDPLLIHATTVGSINYYLTMQETALLKENEKFEFEFKKENTQNIKLMILNYILI